MAEVKCGTHNTLIIQLINIVFFHKYKYCTWYNLEFGYRFYLFVIIMNLNNFEKANSGSLPKVDTNMLTIFFTRNSRYSCPETSGAKEQSSSRDSYGDSAVGCVKLKREGNKCIVQAEICPEHRIHNKNYMVEVTLDEEKELVDNIQCYGCTAALGGSKHALAFLFWMHRKSEQPSSTEIQCYWAKPRLSSVGAQNFRFVQDIIGRKSQTEKKYDVSGYVADLLGRIEEDGIYNTLYFNTASIGSDTFKLSLHQMIIEFKKSGLNVDFISFAANSMQASTCSDAEKATQGQNNSPLWVELRYGRVTASKIYEMARCKTAEGTLVNQVIGCAKIRDTKAMKRGRYLEKRVLEVVGKNFNMDIKKCGMFMRPDLPIFGASPDGITEHYVIEIKCPSNDKSFKNYLSPEYHIAPKCKAQIQLQMYLANRKRGIFCVASPDFEHTEKVSAIVIDLEEQYIRQIIESATLFWKKNIFPKLVNSISNK